MPDWIDDHKVMLGWLATLSLVTFVGSLICVPILIARIPEDYFVGPRRRRPHGRERRPALRLAGLVLKNVAGWLFIAAGIVMLLVPGQGIITIVVGLVLSDFPGKFRLERWLASRRPLMRTLNWIRRRAGRPPLRTADTHSPSASSR